MRALLALVASLVTAASLPVSEDYDNMESFDPYHDIETFKPDEYHERALRATSSDIIYYFFSKNNTENSFQLLISSIATLAKSAFSTQKDTLFVVHGWNNNNNSEMNIEIRKDILQRHDVNVFIVDWSIFAGRNYITAQGSVLRVGEYVGEFVTALQHQFGLDLNKVKFVGHSLGAHVSGIAGKVLNGQLKEITGLDPAGPLFSLSNKNHRLDSADAHYVEVIHSNMGLLGFDGALGHSDFYPNGGRSQPGCGLDILGTCAHGRSFQYYAESLNNDRFIARRCDSYDHYKNGECSSASSSKMGRFEVDTGAQGSYYLNTNDKSPYAQG